MKTFSAAIASTALLLILLLLRRLIWLHLQRLSVHRTTTAVERVLNPPNTSIHDLLVSRALSNERLIKAFALTNTFVSSDVDIHTAFVKRAKSLIKGAKERGWAHFQDIADKSVEVALPHAGKRDFDAFVQEVTMRVALLAILDIDIVDLDSEDILVVSSLITQLWSLSKKPDPIPPDLLPRLNDHLRRLVPDDNFYPNPLDFVIPIWETMWRVVATTVAYARDSSESCVLAELHRSPLPVQFGRFDGTHPSAESFVTEVMRLHPPSQRIARVFPVHTFLPLSFVKLVTKVFGPLPLRREKADIGKVLRSGCTWGADAETFEPLRFHPSRLTPEQETMKSLPFGYGRFKCVAASWAPMAAAIISAAILNRVQLGSQFSLVAGKSIGGREGWDGWSIVTAQIMSRNPEST